MRRFVEKLLPLSVALVVVLGLLLCSCGRTSSVQTAEIGSREQLYSFPEAGFEACFPDQPKVREGSSAKTELLYMARYHNDLTIVSCGAAPENVVSFMESDPEVQEVEKSLDANLLMMVTDYILNLDIDGVDSGQVSYLNYGKVSSYSGMAVFEGYLDLSEYGAGSRQPAGFCCVIVYDDGKMYTAFEVRPTVEEAAEAAESFALIDSTSAQEGALCIDEGGIPAGAISWQEAAEHVGETVTLYGPVVSAEFASDSNGSPTFLDVGASYPDSGRLSLTIWGENRSKFPEPPESSYKGEVILVTGEIYLYDRVCHVEVSSPSQITVL